MVARRRFLDAVREVARSGTTVVTVTHRLEEIIPEVSHVVLLRRGQVDAAGPRAEMLAPGPLERIFEAPIAIVESGGFVSAAPAGER